MLVKCGKYILRDWKEGDWKPSGFNYGSYALEYENEQVGAVARGRSINEIYGIETKPEGRGHGTEFIKMLMKEAKCQGKTIFEVQGVGGKNRRKMEYILRDKLGFERIDGENGAWVKRLEDG